MKILLGIFNTDFFKKFKEGTDILSYSEFVYTTSINPYNSNDYYGSVIEVVEKVCEAAEKIHFILDGVNTPLSDYSVTCRELKLVVNNPLFLGKTVFYRDGAEIDLQIVIEQYLKPTKLPRYVKTNLSLQL